MKSLGARQTRALLDRHGLRPKTSIGQHFVIDPNTLRKVVEIASIPTGHQILEVGPGLGALTLLLLDTGSPVIAIESDRALEPVLAETIGDRARLVWGDAMRADYRRLLGGHPTVLVANLPYQITTPLLLDLLAARPEIASYTVMVQKEAGERLAAAPGSDAYGAASAKVAYFAEARIAARVSRKVFLPMPEVESVIVRLERRPSPPVKGTRARIFAVIDAGFAQRRKTIRRALRGAGWEADDVERALTRAGVAGEARAETLALEAFASMARALPARR